MNLIQAFRRAVIDRTTTTRPTYDKAFDVSNVAFHHHSFPYPIFPMRMGPELAKLLESHPAPLPRCRRAPFPNPTGLSGGVNSEDFGKGAAKNKSSKGGKGKRLQQGISEQRLQRIQGPRTSHSTRQVHWKRLLEGTGPRLPNQLVESRSR